MKITGSAMFNWRIGLLIQGVITVIFGVTMPGCGGSTILPVSAAELKQGFLLNLKHKA